MDLESVTIADKEQHERRRYSKLLPCLSPDGNIQKPIELLSDTPPAPDKRRLVRLPVTGGIERYFTKTEPSPDALTALMNVPPLFLTFIQQLLISLDDSTKDDYNAREFGMKLIVSSATDETLLVSSITCGDIKWLLTDGDYLTDSTLEYFCCLLMREEMSRANTIARDWKPCFITSTLFMTVLCDQVSSTTKFGYSFENAARHQDREIIGKPGSNLKEQ